MDNQEPKIDFTVMGIDHLASDFLNWCMKHRDSLEYQKDCDVMNLKSASATLFFDDFGCIARIDKQLVSRRTVLHMVEIKDTLDTAARQGL